MKKLLIIAFAAFLGSVFTLQAQEVKKVEVKSKEVVKTRGVNPQIKAKAPTTDDKPVANPATAEKSRGKKDCSINVVNSTGYMVEFYVDGISKGTLDAWGESTVKVGSGYKSMYAITTGQTKEWFAEGDCSGKYSFVLLVGGDK
jgi:hypothetical protein